MFRGSDLADVGRGAVDPTAERPALELLVESLLFVADGPVSASQLGTALDREPMDIERALAALGSRLAERGVRIQRSAAGFQLVSAPEAGPFVERFLGLASNRLSNAALETLAIIAYRQPVTRPQIESIRGVNVERTLHTLLARSLVEETGRLDTVGRPVLFGTTEEFLQYFGLSSLDDLPEVQELLPAGRAVLPGEGNAFAASARRS